MVAATRKKAKTRAQNSHMKTRRNFDEAGEKLANKATMLLHKEKMIQNMKFNDWKATNVASFYKKNGVTITRQTIIGGNKATARMHAGVALVLSMTKE